jgi:hypothetical protein
MQVKTDHVKLAEVGLALVRHNGVLQVDDQRQRLCSNVKNVSKTKPSRLNDDDT